MREKTNRNKMRKVTNYLIPVAAVLAISLVFSIFAWRIANRESKESAEKAASYMAHNMDTQLQSLKTHAYDMLNAYHVSLLTQACYAEDATATQKQIPTRVVDNIYQFRNTEKMVENILIYYPQLDRIISRYGDLRTRQFFLLEDPQLKDQTQIYEQRIADVLEHRDTSFYYVKNPVTGAIECYYCRTIPANASILECDRAVILKIDPNMVKESLLQGCQSLDMEYIAMVTKTGEIFTQAGALHEQPQTESQLLELLAKDAYNVTQTANWRMKIYSLPESSQANHFIRTMTWVLVAGLLLASGLGVLMALISYWDRERYLRNLVNQLGGDDHSSLDNAIAAHLEKTYRENLEKIREIDYQRALVRYSFLKELLRMRTPEQSKIEHLCSAYNQSFENDVYSVFVLTPDCNGKRAKKEDIFRFLSEGDFEDYMLYWTHLEEQDIFLANYNPRPDARSVMDRLKWQMAGALTGQIYGSGTSFTEVIECIEEFHRIYYVITGKKFVAYGVQTQENAAVYQPLLDALKNEDTTHYDQLCQEVCEIPQDTAGQVSRYALLWRLYQMPQLSGKTDILDEMFQDMCTDTWRKCLYALITRQDDPEEVVQRQERVASRVVKIITEEYNNPQLSLSVLAERLNVSQSYLSRVFKQEYGENISRFLSKIRVEKAKELMRSGNENLNTIALSVGFLSDMNFIRVFKKLENTTPGNYRKNLEDI